MAIFSLSTLAISLLSIYIGHRIYWEATTGSQRRAISKKAGCLPPTRRRKRIFPNFIPDFGLDFIFSNYNAFRKHRMLDLFMSDLRENGAAAISVNVFSLHFFLTDDPENIKAILTTQFDAWSIGKDRIDMLSSYLGHGIFTNEGKAWKHSRDMLRPCFEKTAVADVFKLKAHCERLFSLLPTNGDEINLQPLLHELTLDVATEFLFGRSTNSLDRGEATEQVQEFIKAFEYCGDPLANENYKRYGYIGLLLPDKHRKRSIKTIQGQ